ncbi:LuxR family transcriptional regulator [Amycolatopsis mediterranei S699]|uniref:LuxR family transcriptional regulator n=2 Tax=Amycolatopsis mediterranei TaxID=33910 RepID=A0A0H3DBE4_AMYMU|nr:helix-turn-helix transcriptional regulator [Amycolatopsis mediterranei]ADJ47403.1 LuxR family transcriptional regulator [Amycolatopsis mediterranei U32]AEK44249.1 LuxR family transcriptional regulator [Amycolatopsis mediterranei S699]AFO79114.1 LuxR family transcriptional regulator [Amycolatopsis mediterranei S699]AGT86242.1 LuxR family transcriptional regulator [Amycolatopsis mediterranei RB]KDO12409.1 LuxR family transcriptional regulator [Amycolatopsis mediterranei]
MGLHLLLRASGATRTTGRNAAQGGRLAREGLSNPELGTRLFLSPGTVEWHLRKAFGKLAISSRRHLRDAVFDGQRRRSTRPSDEPFASERPGDRVTSLAT